MAFFNIDRRIINKGRKPWGYVGARVIESSAQYALNFNGTSDYVEVSNDNALKLSNALSVAVWVKRNGWVNFAAVVQRGYHTDKINYLIGMSDNTGECRARIYNSSGSIFSVTCDFPDAVWIHFVMTWDGSTIKLYKDGNEESSISFTGTAATPDFPLYFASDPYGEDRKMPGQISDVRVYDRALSLSEVGDLYSKTEVSGGLVGHWPMNEGSGSVVEDNAGNNDGTISGATWVEL